MKIVTVARKPLAASGVVQNCLQLETGALAINNCRIRYVSEEDKTSSVGHGEFQREPGVGAEFPHHKESWGAWHVNSAGRWPANLVLLHTSTCCEDGVRQVKTGKAHRTNGGGKTIFSETAKPSLPDLTYADEDGIETMSQWSCQGSCPAARMDRQSGKTGELGGASRFFLQNRARKS